MREEHLADSYLSNVYLVMPVLIPVGKGLFAGGNMNSMVSIGAELASRGHKMHILAGNYDNILNDSHRWGLEWASVYPVSLHPDRRGFARGIEFLIKAGVRALKQIKSDTSTILHVHSGYPQFGHLCWLARKKKVRTVQTIYCPLERRVDDRYYWGLSPNFVRHALVSNDAIVAISQNIKRNLLSVGVPESKIFVIPPSVNYELYSKNFDSEKIKKKLRINQSTKLLVYSGNTTQTKGLDVLIEAYIRLRRSMNNVHLVFALQHQYSKDAERAVVRLENELNREVGPQSYTRLGIINYMPELIKAANVFVSPLRNTNGPADYPLSIMEAMAAGTCVLTTNVGGIPEFMTDGINGRMVAPGDPEQLERVLRELLSNEHMSSDLGRRAALEIRANYTPSKITDMTEDLYHTVLEGG